MELSPLEIRSQKFSRKIKGYDVSEVDNFLEIVSKDLEKLYGEYYSLKEELVKKNQEITDYKEKDKSISEAILMVQSVSNDIKKTAIAEAEAIKKAAIAEAENIIKNSNKKNLEIANNIDSLLNKRIIIINSIKNLLSANTDLINRESDKNMEISFPSEHIKLDITGSVSGIETDAADKEDGNALYAEQINKPESDSKNTHTPNQNNNPAIDADANAEKKEKDLAELLGDINKFTL
ncbi:MAG: DivIVA domain-containing protein [bacterium]